MIILSNVNVKGVVVNSLDLIIKLLSASLTGSNIVANITSTDHKIVFSKSKGELLFYSSSQNAVPLKPTDSRFIKKTKELLLTSKLSESQFDKLNTLLTTYLTTLGYSFNLVYQEFKDDPFALTNIVVDGVVVGKIPMPKSFPKGV